MPDHIFSATLSRWVLCLELRALFKTVMIKQLFKKLVIITRRMDFKIFASFNFYHQMCCKMVIKHIGMITLEWGVKQVALNCGCKKMFCCVEKGFQGSLKSPTPHSYRPNTWYLHIFFHIIDSILSDIAEIICSKITWKW